MDFFQSPGANSENQGSGSQRNSAGRPRQAEAWLAVFGPGQPPLPVRVEFPSTFLGALRLDLVRAGAVVPAPRPNPVSAPARP